ncbi:uncharacterized protein K441DRAFT_675033 [Cenococcum geophilum 1.58]|uniref:uncharacterized protein n=1 Tax=Cenococcum geophilum 1.58 TaxID=794803 RepID=UPI00358FDEF4|nr:hypothetical protein K441DRAFT_675033 [Cenococcum geophilum 1.58]
MAWTPDISSGLEWNPLRNLLGAQITRKSRADGSFINTLFPRSTLIQSSLLRDENTFTNQTSAQNIPYFHPAFSKYDLPEAPLSAPVAPFQSFKPQLSRDAGSSINAGTDPSKHVEENDMLFHSFRPIKLDSIFQQNVDLYSVGASAEMVLDDILQNDKIQHNTNISSPKNMGLVPHSGALYQSVITACSVAESTRQPNDVNVKEYRLHTGTDFLPQLYFGSNELQIFSISSNDCTPGSIQTLAASTTIDGESNPTLPYDNETSAHKNIREDRCNIVSYQTQPGDVVGSEVSSHSNSRPMSGMSDTNTVSPTRRTHRFYCPNPSCTDRSFGRRSDRDRHVRKHSTTERTYACPQSECGKRFYRKDKLLDHTRRGHRPKEVACTCNRSR